MAIHEPGFLESDGAGGNALQDVPGAKASPGIQVMDRPAFHP